MRRKLTSAALFVLCLALFASIPIQRADAGGIDFSGIGRKAEPQRERPRQQANPAYRSDVVVPDALQD